VESGQGTVAAQPHPRRAAGDPLAPGDRPRGREGGDVRGYAHEAFNRARAVKEIAIAKEKELNLRRRQEELLEAADVERAWTEAYIAFANRMRLIPDKLAPRVAALTDVLEIRLLIEKEIRNGTGSAERDRKMLHDPAEALRRRVCWACLRRSSVKSVAAWADRYGT